MLLARRVDVGSLAQTDVVWGWIVASLLLNLASVAGKAIVWKAALDALPEQWPVRYAHVVRRSLSGSCSTRSCSPAWASWRAWRCWHAASA